MHVFVCLLFSCLFFLHISRVLFCVHEAKRNSHYMMNIISNKRRNEHSSCLLVCVCENKTNIVELLNNDNTF